MRVGLVIAMGVWSDERRVGGLLPAPYRGRLKRGGTFLVQRKLSAPSGERSAYFCGVVVSDVWSGGHRK